MGILSLGEPQLILRCLSFCKWRVKASCPTLHNLEYGLVWMYLEAYDSKDHQTYAWSTFANDRSLDQPAFNLMFVMPCDCLYFLKILSAPPSTRLAEVQRLPVIGLLRVYRTSTTGFYWSTSQTSSSNVSLLVTVYAAIKYGYLIQCIGGVGY